MKRAVIYCRTSTTEESQLNALENQVQEASACVKTQGWQLVDSYVESGSGTTTHGRDQYKRLYEDLLLDRFDIIVIKSQDRLMRNVKDWYLFLDCLIRCGKQLYLYLEQKFYETEDGLIALRKPHQFAVRDFFAAGIDINPQRFLFQHTFDIAGNQGNGHGNAAGFRRHPHE